MGVPSHLRLAPRLDDYLLADRGAVTIVVRLSIVVRRRMRAVGAMQTPSAIFLHPLADHALVLDVDGRARFGLVGAEALQRANLVVTYESAPWKIRGTT